MIFSTVLVTQFALTIQLALAQSDADNYEANENTIIEKCDIAQQLRKASVDGFFRDQWICMADKLSQRNTSALRKDILSLDSGQSDPCQQYRLGLFQISNAWCTSETHEGLGGCTRNGCKLDCLKLLDNDITDDIECIKSIHKLTGLSSWRQDVVNDCRQGAEGNKWNYTDCITRGRRAKTITTISLWMAILIVAVTSLIVFGLTYFFYKYRRNSHSVLSTDEIKEFKYGRIRGIPSVIFSKTTVRLSQPNQDDFSNEAYKSEYEISPAEFAIDHNYQLGSGAYGVVYKAMCRGEIVAVKTVNPHASKEYYQSLLGEIKILSHVGRHNFIVNMEGAYTKDLNKGTLYVFMEYCGFGSLEKFLRRNRNKYLTMEELSLRSVDDELKFDDDTTEADADPCVVNCLTIKHLLQYSHQIAKGMEFLSTKKVIHGDLAARNILLVDENTAKISDFGLSRKLYGYVQYIKKKEEPLPWRWMAIESLREMNFSTSSDAWMYGVLLFEIFSLGEMPYPGLSWSLEFVAKLENGFRMLRPKHAPVNVYKDVMLKCWESNPKERPSFFDLSNYFYQALKNITSIDYTEVVETGNRGGSSHMKDYKE